MVDEAELLFSHPKPVLQGLTKPLGRKLPAD